MKITIEEFLEKLKTLSSLTIKDINDLEQFLQKNRLKSRYINAINRSFNSINKDNAENLLDIEISTVTRVCLFSCMVDWSLNEGDNWEYIHTMWGESE